MNNELITNDNTGFIDENGMPVDTQYIDEFGNPIDPSLIDENGNYIGKSQTQYVDEFGNPIDPSLIDENGNYIGKSQNFIDENGNVIPNNPGVQSETINQSTVANALNLVSNDNEIEIVKNVTTAPISSSEHQMDDKEFLTGMVTFDYNNVPITDIVNSIILDAINKGASDIHFDPFDDGIKIRIRIDGELNDYSIVPLFVKKNMITRIKIISGMNITESRTPQDGAIRTELANKSIDLRVSCLPTNMGEKIVIRIMDYSMSAAGIEALDFSEENLNKVKKMLSLPNGIILVTGATGSGKSTTVYSMLQKLNVEGTNLITVEDPIEMNIGGVNQVQAVAEIGLDFATVLRSILRQDPDVIMIGEIRDDETARIAVRASITGHLVLSTIHTNNSLNTIERLTDMSVERYLLGTALSGIVSQKLARRLCDKCKKLRPTNDYEKEVFKKALNKDIKEIYEPVGCPNCSRGYRGRIAIQEVLLLNQTIQDAITKGIPKEKLRKLVYGKSGTQTMLEDGLIKVLDGKTSFEEILKLIDLEDDLGSGSQLGLEDQLEDAERTTENNNQPINLGNNPININITPELLSSLTSINNQIQNIQPTNLNSTTKNNEDVTKLDNVPVLEEYPITNNEEIFELPEEKGNEESVTKDEPTEEIQILDEPTNDISNTEINDKLEQLEVFDDSEELESLENQTPFDIPDDNEPIEILPNLSEENDTIEELDNSIEEKEVIHSLYEDLLDTKKNITKRNFSKQVIEVLNKIKKSNLINSPLPLSIIEYLKEIKESDLISTRKKKDIIEKFNEVFNLNEQIDNEINDKNEEVKIEETSINNNNSPSDFKVETKSQDIKETSIDNNNSPSDFKVETKSQNIEENSIDNNDSPNDIQEENKSQNIDSLANKIIENIDNELNKDDLQDIKLDEIDEDALDFDMNDIQDKDLEKITMDELIIDENTGFNFNEDIDIDNDVILQDDYQIDNANLIIDENSFDDLDEETIDSLLENINEKNEEDEK